MITSLKAKLKLIGVALLAILYAIFKATRRENALLKEVNRTQEESLRTVEVVDEVSTTLHKEHNIQKASIDKSIQATKEKVKNETDSNSTPLDPEYIRLLNEDTD